MPKLLSALSTIGIVAMLWVGGHILLVGVDELGWHTLYDWVHHAEEAVGGGALGWCVNTLASAVIGLVVGARRRRRRHRRQAPPLPEGRPRAPPAH